MHGAGKHDAIATGTHEVRRVSAEIRPGVFRPDWSAVTSPIAREALVGRMATRAGLIEKWSHPLEADEDLVWRIVLRLYADAGRPPTPSKLRLKRPSLRNAQGCA